MSFRIVVPARYASSRLPGKPLAEIAGRPMVAHVLDRCRASDAEGSWVATDDERIVRAVEEAGGEAVMTRGDHHSGTDRLQEVVTRLELADDDIIVNVQGDEPRIPPEVINQVAHNLAQHPDCAMATLCEAITERADVFSPDVVKVVLADNGEALYFSRAPIPWDRDAFTGTSESMPEGSWWRHIGIYAYRVGLLHRYVNWPQGELERLESLEQLRALARGVRIHVAPAAASVPAGVDTRADLEALCKYWGEQA